jgi:hypothetical protein
MPGARGRLCPTSTRETSARRNAEHNDARFPVSLGQSKMDTLMTSQQVEPLSIAEICASVKRLGYGVSQSVRLYGEEFEVISDPFPESGGIAVNVKTKKSDVTRVVQLPATVLQSVRGRSA